jgi:hypothetical protein
MGVEVAAGLVEGLGELEPAGHRERVHGREVDREHADVVLAPRRPDAHATFLT